MIIESLCADDTFAFGKKLGEAAEPGTVYTLVGDLGVGKTVLTQELAEGLGITEAVNSPIEWANLIEEILPEKYTEIRIEKDLEKGFDYRKITVTEVEA